MENAAALTIENLTFTYPKRETPALLDVNLTVRQGEFVLLCGASGSGKTTLLRQLKPALTPHGTREGTIFLQGTPLDQLNARDTAAKIGFVQQNPENQTVTDKVWHELAFGLENLGCDAPAIRLRTAEMASFFGIQAWFRTNVNALSGGQKQLLALAGAMVLQPELLLLDEPTSQLDPIAAAEFLAAVAKINRELGVTVLLTEHRLEEAFALCSRAVVMDGGRVFCCGTPSEVGQALHAAGHGMCRALPAPMRIWAGVATNAPCPVTVRDGREWILQRNAKNWPVPTTKALQTKNPVLELNEVWFRYEKDAPDVIKGLTCSAYPGEIMAILGGNGTGKTTALLLMLGLQKPQRGKVTLHDPRIAAVPQNPQTLFDGKTVEEDLREVLADRHLAKQETQAKLCEIARLCLLEELLQAHPYDLSGGEQQRAALAKVLLLEPKILLLDEPTKGLDAEFKQVFAGILRQLAAAGTAVVMVSHDIEFCAETCARCALFFDGAIVTQGGTRAFFAGNSFYTTAANRMARHVLPAAITVGDVIAALDGTQPLPPAPPPPRQSAPFVASAKKNSPPRPRRPAMPRKLPKRTVAAAVIILLLIPLTLFVGTTLFGGRKYYFTALFIILESMLPFALLFEKRRPQARELVILAVLTALAVAGRTAFFMLPQFKPVAALVIIAGVAFGGEAGFLVGALTGFVSNMLFGQGPWTPWQMFAFGVIGFLAGVLFKKGLLPQNRAALCVFGGLATFVVYGGLLNAQSALLFLPEPTSAAVFAIYLQGLPFDLAHALSTVIFLAVAAPLMLKKLDRVKVKYGLAEPCGR